MFLLTAAHLYRVFHLKQVEEGPDEGDDEGGDDDEEEEDDFNLDAVDYREGKENEEIQEGVVIAEEGDNADDIEELQDKHGDIEDADVGHHQMAIDIEDDERANANKKEGGDAGEDGFGEIAAFELDEAEAAQQMFNANAGGENMIEFKAKRFTQNETSSSSACLTRKASEGVLQNKFSPLMT